MSNTGQENDNLIPPVSTSEVSPIITRLLLQVLEYAKTLPSDLSARPISDQFGAEEIILSIAIDGFRYTLLRSTLDNRSKIVHLSPREIEILRLVCKGLANKEIAALLDISRWTVGTYLRRLFIKTNVNSRTELVARLLQNALHFENGGSLVISDNRSTITRLP